MKKSCFFLLCSVVLISCVPQRKIVYLQADNKNGNQEYYLAGKKKEVRIEPFDQLFITVNSLDQAGYNFLQDNHGTTSVTDASISLSSYTVSDSGYIYLPVIGKIKLQGYTLEESAVIIQEACKRALNSPSVTVRYVNNNVTVLGEVQRPGTYAYTKNQVSIFHAIGLAGDISEYGNRKDVILLREKGTKVYKYHLDLTRNDVISSDNYYLRPNDILYVEPLRIRRWGMKSFGDLPFNVVFTGITTAITTYLLYQSLKK